jgi:hypothetical protein
MEIIPFLFKTPNFVIMMPMSLVIQSIIRQSWPDKKLIEASQ